VEQSALELTAADTALLHLVGNSLNGAAYEKLCAAPDGGKDHGAALRPGDHEPPIKHDGEFNMSKKLMTSARSAGTKAASLNLVAIFIPYSCLPTIPAAAGWTASKALG